MAFTKGHEIPTIDVSLVTAQVGNGDELAFDTASQIAVEPQVNEEDPVQLVVKGILRAQKPSVSTLAGNQITLTDNVFNPELVKILQGHTYALVHVRLLILHHHGPSRPSASHRGDPYLPKCCSQRL